MRPGELMVISDHLNLSQRSPLFGEPSDSRFVDMSNAYDAGLRAQAQAAAQAQGITLHEGVYAWFLGPQFETPAEIRMARLMGAQAVGMSTVPETILARHAGLKVLAMSLLTNMAAGIDSQQLSHAHTLATAKAGEAQALQPDAGRAGRRAALIAGDPMKPNRLLTAILPPLAAALTATLLAGCATPPAERAPLKLTILHTNDHHGRFWPNADGEYGLAARKTLIDRVRAEVKAAGGELLLLDGGDVNTGVPESDLQDAEPDFKGMDLLGYDAMAVGNHEFDKSPEVLAKQVKWVNFPVLSANIYKDGQRLFEPYRVFERGGYRIAVLGLTTDDTAKMVLPANIAGVEFRKPAEEAARLLPELRAKADMVIAATHMGHYANGNRGVNAPGDVEMARSTKGLDLIVGGHSQNPVCMLSENVRNTAYVPGHALRARPPERHLDRAGPRVGQVRRPRRLRDRRPGKVELLRYQLMPVNLKRTVDGKQAQPTPTPSPRTKACAPFCARSRTTARRGCRSRWAPPSAFSTATATACAASPPTWAR